MFYDSIEGGTVLSLLQFLQRLAIAFIFRQTELGYICWTSHHISIALRNAFHDCYLSQECYLLIAAILQLKHHYNKQEIWVYKPNLITKLTMIVK